MKLRNIILAMPLLEIVGVGRSRPYVFTVRAYPSVGWSHPNAHDYKSRVYWGPDVTDMIEAADESVDVTKDTHHIYLESYEIVADQSPGSIDQPGEIALRFGS